MPLVNVLQDLHRLYACRCVPKLLSREALLILIQGGLLVSRTFLTDRISRIEARAGTPPHLPGAGCLALPKHAIGQATDCCHVHATMHLACMHCGHGASCICKAQ